MSKRRETIETSGRRQSVVAELLVAVAGCLVVYVGALIVSAYGSYLPPRFDRGFLGNKAEFFYSSGYFLGFYLHLAGAPAALVCGALQMLGSVRRNYPAVHRRIGRLYVIAVLLFAAPGGLVMAFRAYGGWSGTLCFALLSVTTWWVTYRAWELGRHGRYREHGRWMARSYVLMCSAVFLRLLNLGIAPLGLDHEFAYQLSAWLSWLPPLVLLEAAFRINDRSRLSAPSEASQQAVYGATDK